MQPHEKQDLSRSWSYIEQRDVVEDHKLYDQITQLSLPQHIVDVHTHSGQKDHMGSVPMDRLLRIKALNNRRWCPLPELRKFHKAVFPNQDVDFVTFPFPLLETNIPKTNAYLINETANNETVFALGNPLNPNQTIELIEHNESKIRGVKTYYDQVPTTINPDPENASVFQFFPKELLNFLNNRSLPIMLHVSRDGGISNTVTLHDVIEIASTYPNISVILAHMGRAYNPYKFQTVISQLASLQNIYFDSSMVDEQKVFEIALQSVGAHRLLFGTDLPLSQVRFLRVLQGEKQVTLSKQESYAIRIPNKPDIAIGMNVLYMTKALLGACKTCGVTPAEKENIFRKNALRLIQ
jgi:glutamate-1-semialdehyde 2,1-aminomutase